MKVCDKRNHEIHQIHKSGVLKSLFSCVSCISWFMMICAAFSSYAGVVEATSPVFGLSLKSDGVRQSAGVETLTYSSQWDGGDGATVTIAENGAVVVDSLSGEGTRPWSVQKTGEYTLTHTTYTNGIAGKVETATFVVLGPELTFEYDGGPFVGGKVTINGNLDGWTIYYTLDGSTPTTESLKYIGPFTLSSAANLKAYAVSDSGMSTPLIENNYAVVERARIENVRARQRWPWNGKVDIDFDVTGSAGVSYGVALSVTDTIGGTNLLMRTVTTSDEAAINPTGAKVIPGEYRWTWDAAADLPNGFECDAISVNVDVLGDGAFVYFVRFNANGGDGTMNDEMFIYGVEKALPANAFNRGGYAFAGWATSPDGEKVYVDKQQIRDLSATSDVVINLYAVWVDKVQLWEGGPYWATTNIGAEKPEDYGYYFWWGDTVGYKRENDKWVASDGSNSNFSFTSDNTPTYNKIVVTLQSEEWITSEGVLASEYDAAKKHWGGDWRMPTKQEFDDLNNKCDWTWTTLNGVNGYIVRGKGDYAPNSIFLPCAGSGRGTSLNLADSYGSYWSSVPDSDHNGSYYARTLGFDSSYHDTGNYYRDYGRSVRPLQGFVSAPTNVSATDGTSTANVTVTWSAVAGATSYEIWRGTSNSSSSAMKIGTSTSTSYSDTSATPGTTYYYWVKAVASVGTSVFSSCDSGYKKIVAHDKVQLWKDGPYWATTNIGAEKPEDYGYYFWWGDTVGYKRENNKWVASDGSNSNFSFDSSNTPTRNKGISTLQSEGWITADGVLAPEHDAAQAHWGGDWRMPTEVEFDALISKCDWTWATMNGVNGYVVCGRGEYASNSIFLPCAGYGYGTSLYNADSYGYYWSSVPNTDYYYAWNLYFNLSYHSTYYYTRYYGQSVRPLQGFTK